MIESNTNKLTWVAICVGLIAILGLGAMSLFPNAMDSAKSAMIKTVTYEAAIPKTSINTKQTILTYQNNYEPSWNCLEYHLNDSDMFTTKPKSWGLMELYFQIDQEAKYTVIDINNYIDIPKKISEQEIPWYYGNDHDDISKREMTWYDENGKILNRTGELFNIKANRTYHVVFRWYNDTDRPIYQYGGWTSNQIGFRPVTDINENTTMKIKVWGFREY